LAFALNLGFEIPDAEYATKHIKDPTSVSKKDRLINHVGISPSFASVPVARSFGAGCFCVEGSTASGAAQYSPRDLETVVSMCDPSFQAVPALPV
jgi:hypothetical protein